MAIYKRDGIFESFPGSGKPTMDDPKIIDLNENHGKIDLPYIKHWILHDPKRAKGAYPTFVEDGVRDLAYRMLIQDAKRDGKTIREDGLENVRMEAIRRFGYAADAFHIGNDIVVGRELSKEDKYKKLAHEVAGADLVAQGKNHVHYRNGSGKFMTNDEFFRAGRDLEKKYVDRAMEALYNMN